MTIEPESEAIPSDEDHAATAVGFDSLPLPPPVRGGIQDVGFEICTPIQAKILPLALAGRDVAGQAQTGTGKTAAFLITIFTRLIERGTPRRPAAPRALVIAPTRELVVQIKSDADQLNSQTGFSIQAVYGGVDYRKQRESLTQDVDILVGTPGRLIDYFKQRVYDLRAIEVLVIDEADRMFDMGFIKDLRFILRQCPPVDRRQSMLFSATLSHDVMELAYMFMNDAVRVAIKPEQVTAERVEHQLYHVGLHEKLPALLGVLKREGTDRTLVFVNMRRTADRLCHALAANGYGAEQITGDIDQRKRLRILTDFREGRLPILVATDVASRGLHIEGVTHVINYDLPLDAEDYVHRVGRTARAGASGKAITLACEDYVEGLEAIEKLIGFKLPHDFPDESMLVASVPIPRAPRRRLASASPRAGRTQRERRPDAEYAGSATSASGPTRRRSRGRRRSGAADGESRRSDDVNAGKTSRELDSAREGAVASSRGGASPGSRGTAEDSSPAGGASSGTKRRRRRRRRSRKTGEAAALETRETGTDSADAKD
jgi:ATP-dependent RNA helicase RhlB